MRSAITVVAVSPGPEPAAREVVALNAPDRGVAVIDTPLNAYHLGPVAHQVFDALGQISTVAGGRVRATRHQLPLLTVALAARPVHHLAVDNAQRLGAATLGHLAGICLAADTRLWMIARYPTRAAFNQAVAAWPHSQASWGAARRQLATTPGPPETVPVPFPTVPRTEFPFFLSVCQTDLDPGAYRQVHDAYYATLEQAQSALGGRPDATTTLSVLRRLLADAGTVDHAQTIARAVTAAAFNAEVHLSIDTARFRAAVAAEPWLCARRASYDELWVHRRPERAAVGALAAAGLSVDDLCAVTIADTEALAATGPEAARPHLHRLLLGRVAAGAAAHEALLTLADGRPVTARWVRGVLADHAATLGGPADRRARRPRREPILVWGRRLGLRARRFA